ncbi:hypothetical protein [Streptomyces smyrnaeus]|uniref:hypothetical protein n=1 Tax=Streptomyces smyrnaeus TaxID=1387713 RepID=UPI00368EF52B
MGHSTDLKSADGTTTDDTDFATTVARVLANVAENLTENRPAESLDNRELLTSIDAEAYKVCGRSIGSRSAHVSRAAMLTAPAATGSITRGEYALRLRRTLGLADNGDAEGGDA